MIPAFPLVMAQCDRIACIVHFKLKIVIFLLLPLTSSCEINIRQKPWRQKRQHEADLVKERKKGRKRERERERERRRKSKKPLNLKQKTVSREESSSRSCCQKTRPLPQLIHIIFPPVMPVRVSPTVFSFFFSFFDLLVSYQKVRVLTNTK